MRGRPRVTFSSHVDTVPGNVKVREEEGRVFGRGACDAKGQIVAQIGALERFHAAGGSDFACLYVVGEEVDSIGARRAVSDAVLATPYLVNGEPTGNRFARRSMGVMELKLTAHGKAGHSARRAVPSAIHRLLDDLGRIVALANDRRFVNVGTITGGTAPNVSAAEAEAELCVRFDGEALDTYALVARATWYSVLRMRSPAIRGHSLHVPADVAESVPLVPFCSDAALFAKKFEHVMLFGAGTIDLAHGEEESVGVEELVASEQILHDLLWKL